MRFSLTLFDIGLKTATHMKLMKPKNEEEQVITTTNQAHEKALTSANDTENQPRKSWHGISSA